MSAPAGPIGTPPGPAGRRHAWVVFALTVALMLSDYTTRSVISGVLPDLKRDWGLDDSQLGALVSVVPLIVGIAAWPIALLADRWGHVRSITVMATTWCVATMLCGLSQSHSQLLLARAAVGLGEAGYGSVGGAVLSSVFPAARLSAVLGAFQAAAVFGTVLGVVLGGWIGAGHGWQAAFLWAGGASLLLVAAYPVFVREPARAHAATDVARSLALGQIVRSLLAFRSVRFIYLASGLQILIIAALAAWMPSFVAREYGFAADQAAARGGMVILMVAVGMIVGGALADRIGGSSDRRKILLAAAFSLLSFILLTGAFVLPVGAAQMALLFVGALMAGGPTGILVAVVIRLTPSALRATAIGTMALANNLLGLAPGPYLVGLISDATNLKTALAIVPVGGLTAGVLLLLAARTCEQDVAANAARELEAAAGS